MHPPCGYARYTTTAGRPESLPVLRRLPYDPLRLVREAREREEERREPVQVRLRARTDSPEPGLVDGDHPAFGPARDRARHVERRGERRAARDRERGDRRHGFFQRIDELNLE